MEMELYKAALIDLGCNPFVSLIITILVTGAVVWVALTLLGFANFISEPFKGIAAKIIMWAGVAYVVLVALQIIFGISIISGVTAIGCG